ncbi:MAG: riboflavin synthase [Rhodobacterales bacterium 32-66-7]|nr:MAG: riboflavin synthase [Rhodobacterales bacterium 32-66-7]
MFTGIVTDIGRIIDTRVTADLRARIATRYDVAGIDIGASIACDGVCLTVVALGTEPEGWFDVEISGETVSKTNLSGWAPGSRVNLERALKVGDELGGHIEGSVALNGTSLTVNEVEGADFGVNFIPHTQAVTTWGDVAVGDLVNLEVDTMARYVARLREYD